MADMPANLPKFASGAKVNASFETSLGAFACQLFADECPLTVGNFVGLATGEIAWTDPQGKPVQGTPLYNGTIFHRVIKNFMIQGADPAGTGRGGPGYRFCDGIVAQLKHDKPATMTIAEP